MRLPAWLRPKRRVLAPLLTVAPLPPVELLGSGFPPYRRLYPGEGAFCDPVQAELARLPVSGGLLRGPVGGYLRPDDALLLHDMAAHAAGNVLELGCYLGLSTTIMGAAIRASGGGRRVVSLEIEPAYLQTAGRRFGAAFIDRDDIWYPRHIEKLVPPMERDIRIGWAYSDID